MLSSFLIEGDIFIVRNFLLVEFFSKINNLFLSVNTYIALSEDAEYMIEPSGYTKTFSILWFFIPNFLH